MENELIINQPSDQPLLCITIDTKESTNYIKNNKINKQIIMGIDNKEYEFTLKDFIKIIKQKGKLI